jgi:predicted DCC family thiol-disulfide oxidoreductase YuxK
MHNTSEHTALILFDGVCNFCNSSVNFVIRKDKKSYFRFASLQSSVGKAALQRFQMDHLPMDSIVLIENDKLYKQSTAVLRIARKLSGVSSLLYVFVLIPSFIRDAMYKVVARNRYKWFGKQESCMLPTAEVKERFIS